MKIYKLVSLILLISMLSGKAEALQTLYAFDDPKQVTRFQSFIQQVRCVVCQNQSVAESNAPLAADLREKIYHLMKAHQTDDQINNYLVTRYGESILFKPRLSKISFLLWAFPLIAVLGVILINYGLTRKMD